MFKQVHLPVLVGIFSSGKERKIRTGSSLRCKKHNKSFSLQGRMWISEVSCQISELFLTSQISHNVLIAHWPLKSYPTSRLKYYYDFVYVLKEPFKLGWSLVEVENISANAWICLK